MKYLSVCSGIEAASCAWHTLGWTPVAFAEIESFPCAVLAHHYPNVPNWGDLTKFKEWPDADVDVLVGGTPCQSFSVAGLRKGLDDPRGNLTLTYLAVAAKYRPKWLVWENVPGVLSDKTGAFGAFLGGLGQLGYGFAYRVLDAQHFGVPQRRRRVFVVGYLGDWRRAAAVLFERESLSGNPAPRREAREGIADRVADSLTKCRASSPDEARGTASLIVPPPLANPLTARMHKGINTTCDEGQTMIPVAGGGFDVRQQLYSLMPQNSGKDFKARAVDVAQPLMAAGPSHGDQGGDVIVTHSLRADGFDASEDGTGRGTPLVPVCFSAKDHGADAGELAPTLRAGGHKNSHANAGVMPAVAFDLRNGTEGDVAQTVQAAGLGSERGGNPNAMPATLHGSAVRRLTPRECERLQGFPDDYTLIPVRGKPAADGPRYKALGNSMAVPCMSWLGQRIALVGQLAQMERAA